MQINISDTKQELGRRAAAQGAVLIRRAILEKGRANIIVATGASQFEMLDNLVQESEIDWGKVTAFHLDEYVAMSVTHPASFRKYLQERFVGPLPQPIGNFHYVDGEGDPTAECDRLNAIIAQHPIDLAFVGIGENGHLAFNDPPADFETEAPYIVVNLDEACRRQQLGEGWFESLEEVPREAISMSIRQIMKSQSIICSVPDGRKAAAVQACVEGEVTPLTPASILQQHDNTMLFLDKASASALHQSIIDNI
jgi:glucosamine-6-phosphate deaminase